MSYFLAPALRTLVDEVNALYPFRDRESDGWIGDTSHQARPSDHNPAPPDGIVRAYDFDEDLIAGIDALGEAGPLVDQITADPRTGYVIYEGEIWTRDQPWWRPYTGPNAHRRHVHVSVSPHSGRDRDASAWNITRTTDKEIDDMFTEEDRDRLVSLQKKNDSLRALVEETHERFSNNQDGVLDAIEVAVVDRVDPLHPNLGTLDRRASDARSIARRAEQAVIDLTTRLEAAGIIPPLVTPQDQA